MSVKSALRNSSSVLVVTKVTLMEGSGTGETSISNVWTDQLPYVKWTSGQVQRRVEHRQPAARPRVVTQHQKEVAAGSRLQAERLRPEAEGPARAQSHAEPLGEPDLGPGCPSPLAVVGEAGRQDLDPGRLQLQTPGHEDQTISKHSQPAGRPAAQADRQPRDHRSEEHTSELQSPMY